MTPTKKESAERLLRALKQVSEYVERRRLQEPHDLRWIGMVAKINALKEGARTIILELDEQIVSKAYGGIVRDSSIKVENLARNIKKLLESGK